MTEQQQRVWRFTVHSRATSGLSSHPAFPAEKQATSDWHGQISISGLLCFWVGRPQRQDSSCFTHCMPILTRWMSDDTVSMAGTARLKQELTWQCIVHKIDNWCCVWQALEHREAALKLAEHWKEEAIKQAKFAQVRIFSNSYQIQHYILAHDACSVLACNSLAPHALCENAL